MNGVVLTAYDGSANAERAVDQAAALFAGADAVVLTVWQSVGDATAGPSGGRALGLGSVSNAVVYQGARPVVGVPSVDGAGGS